jgi:hypothetical protein
MVQVVLVLLLLMLVGNTLDRYSTWCCCYCVVVVGHWLLTIAELKNVCIDVQDVPDAPWSVPEWFVCFRDAVWIGSICEHMVTALALV